MVTITLYDYIQSELQEQGFDEYVNDDGELVFFDEDHQFMTKILDYDDDVQFIVDRLFNGVSLENREHDEHFKQAFLYRFINREINRQTIESFKLELMATFLSNKEFINRLYTDGEKYITQANESLQENNQSNTGENITDTRQAFSELPQSNVNIDVNDTEMTSANDNTISRNKQSNNQENHGETSNKSNTYQLDELFKTNGLLEEVLNTFDKKCFLQIW